MKVLSIGNSFSTDAHRWLHKLAKANDEDIQTTNLYIGGCSLETHWKNIEEHNAFYDLEINGNEGERKIDIEQALNMDKWDIITVQQVSSFSGMYETFEPYLSSLVSLIKKTNPQAKLYFHQTWAYETDSDHHAFVNYNNNQKQMYSQINSTSKKAAESIGAVIIPVGEIINLLRHNIPEFDYGNGGISLCRDGFHLSLDYGRYAAAATWFCTLTGKPLVSREFEDFNPDLITKINNAVNKYFEK